MSYVDPASPSPDFRSRANGLIVENAATVLQNRRYAVLIPLAESDSMRAAANAIGRFMTPDEIYVRATDAQRALPIPAYVTYVTAYRANGASIACQDGHIVVSFGGHAASGSYRVTFRTGDGFARSVDTVTEAPCLGVPLLSPTGGDIGKLAEPPVTPRSPHASAGPLPVIASVVVRSALHYRILSATPETLNGDAVDHLKLQAISDPATYPLTDLYVDATTFLVRRIVATFSDRYGGVPADDRRKPATSRPFRVTGCKRASTSSLRPKPNRALRARISTRPRPPSRFRATNRRV